MKNQSLSSVLRWTACALGLVAHVYHAQAQQWIYRHVDAEDTGDWQFQVVASSFVGSILVAAGANVGNGPIYTSTNYGTGWQPTAAPLGDWSSIALSSNGFVLAGCTDSTPTNEGGVYLSLDFGESWDNSFTGAFPAIQVVMSADGTKLLAAKADSSDGSNPFGLYHSADMGVTWQPVGIPEVTNYFSALASSADGTNLVAVGSTPPPSSRVIYTSRDSGASWQLANLPQYNWTGVAASTNCSKIVVVAAYPSSVLFTSEDYGVTWQQQKAAPPEYWGPVASSADGTRLVAAGGGADGQIYTSMDSGATWQSTNGAPVTPEGKGVGWLSVASSADGKHLVAAPLGLDGLYTLDPIPDAVGHVYCACNSNAIPGAKVLLGTDTLTCDENGYYALTNVQPGIYTAVVSATNYATLTTNVVVDGAQPTMTNNFYLTNTTDFIINPILDSSITVFENSDAISNAIVEAAQSYSNLIVNPMCVQILFYATNAGLGSSLPARAFIQYSNYYADLEANTNMSANDIAALATLHAPPNTGIYTNTTMVLTAAAVDAIGEHALAEATVSTNRGLDSEIWLNISIMNITSSDTNTNNYDLETIAKHEIDETLGIGGPGSSLSFPGTNFVGSMDLYRYVSLGFRSFYASPFIFPYFSIDDGASNMVFFNQNATGDLADWGNGRNTQYGNTPPQVQDAFATPGIATPLGVNELVALDIIGYTLSGKATIQAPNLSAGILTFTAQTLPGQTYQVQYSPDLTPGSWQNLGSPFVATGLTQTVTDATAGAAGERFYRVVLVPVASPNPAFARSRPAPIIPTPEMIVTNGSKHYFRPRGP